MRASLEEKNLCPMSTGTGWTELVTWALCGLLGSQQQSGGKMHREPLAEPCHSSSPSPWGRGQSLRGCLALPHTGASSSDWLRNPTHSTMNTTTTTNNSIISSQISSCIIDYGIRIIILAVIYITPHRLWINNNNNNIDNWLNTNTKTP